MSFYPPVSVVINTDGRAASLQLTLHGLKYLDYPTFEVCVVHGPTRDGTPELLEKWSDRIKIAACPERNLSMSRNIGIALAAGDIVAFIDDDAIPEPDWLNGIAAVYARPDVGAAGGFVYDNTGTAFQWRYGTTDRLARSDTSWMRSAPELNFPFSQNVPHLLGANSSLRRQAAIAVGGFDEEFDYFLDETDILCRVNDAGWKIVQLDGACVHHKYLPSAVRNEAHAIKSWYSIVKNKIYFSVLNARGHHTLQQAIEDGIAYVATRRAALESAIAAGELGENDRVRFHDDIERAWREGLRRGLSGRRRLMSQELPTRYGAPFLPFSRLVPAGGRRTVCLLSQGYPPHGAHGVARYVHQLARAIAALGHHVHVLTRGRDSDTVDFEDGVWVHRIMPKSQPQPATAVPAHIWDHSATMLAEAKRIAASRAVDAVIAPIWDCEGLAFLLDGELPLITSLQTTLTFWLDSNQHKKSDRAFAASFVAPMLAAERLLFQRSPGILAISHAIARDVEERYDVHFSDTQLTVVPIGLDDWAALDWKPAEALPADALRLLFVGRLEERKGIDVLFDAIKQVLPAFPHVYVDIVGDDALINKDGTTYRRAFVADAGADSIRDRVRFHGEVSDAALRGFYRACDIFVAPSRFESFGLILLEAMMFAKPVIGCRAGGMVEIVEHGESGLLAEPGDAASLVAHLRALIDDADLRRRLGLAGRRRYERLFAPERMAEGVLAAIARLSGGAKIGTAAHLACEAAP